ncbi:MAG: hypothetical protein LRY54_03040 [Alphaproteobacteria bacterium]|nr:hypothetical protein [Alphaproteobacteria bacterium]
MVSYSARKILLYSVLGALCTSPVALMSAWAEDAPVSGEAQPGAPVYFYPASAWDIKPLEDSETGLKICAISAQFNNGFFIQMSAAQEGINSISINFRQPVFTAGSTANVGISAPGVIKKLLPAVAYKPELLVINFEGQSALFDAIKTAGVMDFSMGAENQFRFYLSGFALALPRLAQCMQNHASAGVTLDIPVPEGTPAAPVPVETMVSAPPPEDVPQYAAQPQQQMPVQEQAQPQPQSQPSYAPPAAYYPPAAVSDERAPQGRPTAHPVAEAVAPPTPENPLDPVSRGDMVLRTGTIEQEPGRAPPPPPRRLDEIKAPPVYTDAEPVISSPSPDTVAKAKAAMERYQQEMSRVMPEEQLREEAPAQASYRPENQIQQAPEAILPESDADSSGVLKSGSQRERIGKKRLSDMLADDMARQYEEMTDDGRLRPDIKAKLEAENVPQEMPAVPPSDDMLESPGETYQLKPLVVPLVKRGSAEEKALADILGQPTPDAGSSQASPPLSSPQPPAVPAPAVPSVPEKTDMPPALKAAIAAPAVSKPAVSKPAVEPEVPPVLKSGVTSLPKNSVSFQNGEAMPKAPSSVSSSSPKITRQTESIKVDLTDVNKPVTPADVLPSHREKNWLEILQDQEAASPADDMSGVYVPAPVSGVSSRSKAVDVKKVPAMAPRTRSLSESSALTPEPESISSSADTALLAQKLSALQKENAELEAELAAALAQGKHETVSIENNNWNLERATEMYNEAKKQMDRLGAQIQKERAQCAAEKKDLETMLFDPQLTQEEQLARLSELEEALNAANSKLEEQRQVYEGRIKLLQDQVGRR